MHMQRIHEIVLPVNKPDHRACPLGDPEFMPVRAHIDAGTIRPPVRLRRFRRDVGPPSAFECIVQDADQGLPVRALCRTRDTYSVTSYAS